MPFYLFGHTHQAKKSALCTPDSPPYYINSGSWCARRSVDGGAEGNLPPLTYVEIDRPHDENDYRARLMVWVDRAGRSMPMPTS